MRVSRPRLSSLARVWAYREYRACLLLMVLMSLGTSAGTPVISLFLVNDVGVNLSQAGLFFTSMAIVGLVLGVGLGRRSDRWRSRLPFVRWAIVWAATGWLVLALSPFRWVTMCAGAVFLSLAGVLMGQVFASLHDVMTREHEAQPTVINTTVRTGWSFGFVFGPLLGSTLASQVGFRATFIAAACLQLLCLLPLRGLDVAVVRPVSDRQQPGRGDRNLPLLVFGVVCALVLCGTAIKNVYLPIDVTAHLKGSISTFGTIIAVSPILELLLIPLCGLLAVRIGVGRLIAAGLLVGAVEYLLLTRSTMLWQLYMTQAMDAFVVAVVLGLGVTYAQQLSPNSPGIASGILFASFNLGGILGNLAGSTFVPLLGIPHIFLIPSALCGLSWLLFMAIQIALRSRATSDTIRLARVEGVPLFRPGIDP